MKIALRTGITGQDGASIERPVFSTVMSLIIVVFGLVSYRHLGVREYPSVDPPIISVSTTYTGAPPEVTGVLKDFGTYVADPSQHPSMILVGNGRTGQWTRFFGFPSADQLMAKVEELRLARAASAAGAGGNG